MHILAQQHRYTAMHTTAEFKQHVINQLSRYIEDTRKNVVNYDESIHDMVLEDAQYAETVLNKYKDSGDWYELRDDLIHQDTLPREECFHYLVEKDINAAQRVGLTWQLVNE